MALIKSLVSALSTYSRIPMPSLTYKDGEGRFTLCFFPLVGVIIAAIEYLWFLFCWYGNISGFCQTIGCCIIPLLITGGIHLDGFMDTMDALHSFGDKGKKLSILKDPHIGAFSVIKLVELAGLWVIGFSLIFDSIAPLAFAGFIVSRILSAISISTLKTAKEDGMVYYTKSHASNACKYILFVFLMATYVACIMEYDYYAFLPIAVSLISMVYYVRKVDIDFGGITGDTSGCFLTMVETGWILSTMLICAVRMI